MLIKVEVDATTFRKIEELVNDGTFSDIRQFLNVAISNQLEEELSTAGKMQLDSKAVNASQVVREIAVVESKNIGQNLMGKVSPFIESSSRQQLRAIQLESSQIKPAPSDLIWYFYNRFFPIKLVIYQLAQMIVTQQKSWIELEDLQVQAFEFAEAIATKLKNIEVSGKIARNKKLSTGLPTSRLELVGLRGADRRKKEDKLIRGRTRFMDQIVGKYVPKDRTFSGACFDMGLVGIKSSNQSSSVTLTELGREFALLENPILDKDMYESAFSDREVSLIFAKIYDRFRLEKKIANNIIDLLKKETLTASQIDELFKKENRKSYTVERIAMMGRLSELNIVNWEIDSEGKSLYRLNKEKLQTLN